MKKTTGVDSIPYIFISSLVVIGLILWAIQWGLRSNCTEIVEFQMQGVKYTNEFVVGDLIEFNCAEDAKNYAWDFGDGFVTGIGGKETHIYKKEGIYTVKLILNGRCDYEKDIRVVSGDGQATEESAETTVRMPKIAAPGTSTYGSMVSFKETSGNGRSWKWNFGDGGTSTKQNPRYRYGSSGRYTVRVRINGEPERAIHKILIKPKPEKRKPVPKPIVVKKPVKDKGKPILTSKPVVKKEIFIQDKKFLRMLNNLAKHKTKVQDFEKYLDTKNGFAMTSIITVNNKQEQLSTYLTTIYLTDNCEATKVVLTTTEKGFISKITITE